MMSEPKILGDEYGYLMRTDDACLRDQAPGQSLRDAMGGNAVAVLQSKDCLSENHDFLMLPGHNRNRKGKNDNAVP
jgi:hypothetical protein